MDNDCVKCAYSYIRFSSRQQARGDSLRRQTEEAARWAEENGYTLKDLSFRDLGVSAYSGANIRGGLGEFLKAIEAGVVKPGESLLIESLDRLSRDEVLIALGVFGQILLAGVNIITWSDRRVYTSENISDIGNIMYSIMIMCRAHEESQIKSKRAAATWAKRREDAVKKGTPISAHCPPWLRIENGEYVIISERARIVDSIFELSYFEGMGSFTIAKHLNQQNIPSFTGKPWTESAITRLLHNTAVYGEYAPQTTRYEGGKRIKKKLPPIRGFYPELMDSGTFRTIELELSKRRVLQQSGRRGKKRNIFTHMVKCVHCAAKISYKNKTRASYLAAHSAAAERSCTCHRYWPYPDFEKRVLAALVDYQKVAGIEYQNEMFARVRTLIDENDVNYANRDTLLARRVKLIELVDEHSLPELNQKLQEVNVQISKLDAIIDENDKWIHDAGKYSLAAAIDTNLDPEDDAQRMELTKLVREMIQGISADMEKRTATIYLHNDDSFEI